MSRPQTLSLITAMLLLAAAAGLADEGGEFLEGQADAVVRYTTLTDALGRVGEYTSPESVDRALPGIDLDLYGGRGSTLFDIMMLYRDRQTHAFAVGVRPDGGVRAELGYRAFVHNLDHDLMDNLQVRERVWNGTAYAPGGKQVYHTDNDPLGRYHVEHSRFAGEVAGDLRFLPGRLQAFAGYADQRQQGTKQAMTLDHCATCHVTSNARQVDLQTESWYAGFGGDIGKVAVDYRLRSTEFFDHTATPSHLWKAAVHPVNGGSGPEFASRLQFSDEVMPYGRTAQSERISHEASVKVRIDPRHTLRGAFTHARRENNTTGVQSELDAYAAAWTARPAPAWRINARFLAYETKVDDYAVDLDPFRGVAALDFDWNRISAANREVAQIDLAASYKPKQGSLLKLDLRHQTVDRQAMTTSQTRYTFDDLGAVDEALIAAPFANETTVDRARLSYNQRLGMKGNARVTATLTQVDQPFLNPTAMCEESLEGTNSAHTDPGNAAYGRLYYYQRQRHGNGTNRPSQALQLGAQASYQVGPRLSLGGFLNLASEKNDELNNYEFTRDLFSPGVNVWAAPHDKVLWTLGYAFSRVRSSAALCPPIFDG